MANGNAIDHLEAIRLDIRDEIKKRIEQRDRFSIQLTIALGTIVAVSFSSSTFQNALVAAPLVSIYFTVQILYSYRVNELLGRYLRERIEPELARLCGTPPEMEWEGYYREHALPGIRKIFFILALWIVCIITPLYLYVLESNQTDFILILAVISSIYLVAAIAITKSFWKG